jgi:hypothetical protein
LRSLSLKNFIFTKKNILLYEQCKFFLSLFS